MCKRASREYLKRVTTLLCPTDFSAAAEDALEVAIDLAGRIGDAKVVLLHVDTLPTYGLPEGSILDEDVRRHWAEQLENVVKRHEGEARIETASARGAAYATILERAEELGAYMIVMSTGGHSKLAATLLGSVTEKVVRLSPVPVLTVRPRT